MVHFVFFPDFWIEAEGLGAFYANALKIFVVGIQRIVIDHPLPRQKYALSGKADHLPRESAALLLCVFDSMCVSSYLRKGLTITNLLYSMSTFHGHTMISIEVKSVERHCADAAEHWR